MNENSGQFFPGKMKCLYIQILNDLHLSYMTIFKQIYVASEY